MKNSKKTIALFAASLGALCALVGCGETGSSSSSAAASTSSSTNPNMVNGGDGWVSYDGSVAMQTATTITYYTNRTDLDKDGSYRNYVAKFNKTEPNITVKVISMTDYNGDLEKMLQAKNYGDVSMITLTELANLPNYYVSFGTLDNLKATKKYRDEYLTAKYYKDNVYGLPYMNTVGGIAYNKKVFTGAGVDAAAIKTPDQFVAAMQAIKTKYGDDVVPYYTNNKDGWTANQWEDHFKNDVLHGDLDYSNTKIAADKNVFKPDSNDAHYLGTKIYFDLIAKGLVEADPNTSDWESSKGKINEGKIGAMCMGNWAISQFKEATYIGSDGKSTSSPENIGYMPFPFTTESGVHYANSGSDYCYGISKQIDATHKEASERFVNWMVEQSGIAIDEGGIGIIKTDPMPSTLEAFSDCTFFISNASEKGWEDAVASVEDQSGQKLYDDGTRFHTVAAIALGSGDYASKLAAFNTQMTTWNTAWAKASTSVTAGLPALS